MIVSIVGASLLAKNLVREHSRASSLLQGDLRTLWYRRLAWVSLFSIIIALSLPGHWIEALQVWALTWWPWPSSGLASSPLPIDKVIHASLFAVCAALFVRGWTTFRERWWVICLMLFLYGVVTEVILSASMLKVRKSSV